MTKREVQRGIERYVASKFPCLRPIGDLLVERQGPLLVGFIFERSQMDKRTFRLRAFVQVLSVPSDALTLELSKELGDFQIDGDAAAAFSRAADEAARRGNDFLRRGNECGALLRNLDSLATQIADLTFLREIRAHCLIELGRDAEALHELARAENELYPPGVAYEHAALDRIRALADELKVSHDQAVSLLDSWTWQTVEALRLTRLEV